MSFPPLTAGFPDDLFVSKGFYAGPPISTGISAASATHPSLSGAGGFVSHASASGGLTYHPTSSGSGTFATHATGTASQAVTRPSASGAGLYATSADASGSSSCTATHPLVAGAGVALNPLAVLPVTLDAAADIHLHDAGVAFSVTVTDGGVPVDLSRATSASFVFQKPDGTTLTAQAATSAAGLMTYVTSGSDLDQTGTWRYQAVYSFGSETEHLTVLKFKVNPNLPF